MTPHTLTAEDLEFSPPSFPIQTLLQLARDAFEIEGDPTPLRGERDQNLKITTASGESFVLKVANAFEDPGIVDFQLEGLLHLTTTDPDLPTPRVVLTADGDTTAGLLGEDGRAHATRVLTFLPGDVFEDDEVTELDADPLERIGRHLGRLCRALASFDHPHAEHFMAWDISNGLVTSDALWAHAQPDLVELAGWTQQHLTTSDFTTDTIRRSQIIHNDAHRGNILRMPGTADICGLIDFGDMLVAPLANELAIPGISFARAQPDPLDALTPVIAGFHAEHPLEPIDVAVLYDSITARAVLTALLFDFQIAECPDMTDNIPAARPRVIEDLLAWLAVDPAKFHDHISAALEDTR